MQILALFYDSHAVPACSGLSSLVYAHAYADVVRQKHPFLSMVKLFPLVEITEPILVRPFEIPAVNPPVP